MGREVGGGIGMGKTCEPKAFSFQCMTKFTTKKKKVSEKKKKGSEVKEQTCLAEHGVGGSPLLPGTGI